MSAPRIALSKGDQEGPKGQVNVLTRSPHWVVAFVRFKEPCAMFSGSKQDAFETKDVLVVENDCIQVSVSNSKDSFAKSCTLTMKLGDVWYQNAVHNGDWVFVWMTENIQDSEKILNALMRQGGTLPNFKSSASYNFYDSGLKFVGRVIGLSNVTSISTASGQMNLTQTVSCQAFLEMANSIYYTFISKALLSADNPELVGEGATLLARQNLESIRNVAGGQSNGMDAALSDIADKFLSLNEKKLGFTTPEEMIAIMFILMMGVEKEKSVANVLSGVSNLDGSFGDAIGIPREVAVYLGRPGKPKLWQMYNVILGLQKYSGGKEPWQKLFPNLNPSTESKTGDVFHRTTIPTKGMVPLNIPPIWDNRTLWQTMGQYLNSVVNEMYTCLRVDRYGKIMPTLVVREKPFSTGLFNDLNEKAALYKKIPKQTPAFSKETKALADKISIEKIPGKLEEGLKILSETTAEVNDVLKKTEGVPTAEKINDRTFYCNLPRWIIPEEKVISIQTTLDENKRVNFVQVWGRSNSAEYAVGPKWDQEYFKALQYLNGNYVADEADIARSGLRADIQETIYDIILDTGKSLSNLFARMRADWSFNGHLKPYGTITMMGVQEPICEGDNLEYQGIVYHITGVSHSGSISSNGIKTFITTIQIENGILAQFLKSESDIPRYVESLGGDRDSLNTIFGLKGKTDIQNTGTRKGRSKSGEDTSKKGKKGK